jgi:2-keto-4-pentenoate hydratase/2-oxohepta-3-ene-1,7-dioic acid hydratase in catechol pathway
VTVLPCVNCRQSAHETDHSFTSDQKRLVLGKSYYGYAPLGSWMVSADEVPNPQEMDVWLEVNGVRRQTDNTHP